MADQKVTVDLTTGIGTISFPHLSKEAAEANKNDKGEPIYDLQFIIPKSDKESIRAILLAIKKVGEGKWGENWKKVRHPLRDGDKEAGDLTQDGSSTKGEKYPERLGCFFFNARSTKPVPVVGRDRTSINDFTQVYGGCKVKVAVSFYAYSNSGNHGIGVGLNGVQKISDGEPLSGGGKPTVESMFDMLEEDADEFDALEDIEETEEAPAKPAAKKAAPAKKAPAKRAAAKPAPEPEEIEVDEDEEDLYADLDDLDDSDA